MRHGAVTLADRVTAEAEGGQDWDLVFVSDMLDLAQFRGLVPQRVAAAPVVFYFHENQLTYPTRRSQERDLHFGLTNLVSAASADRVWFNSDFHRMEFLAATRALVSRMPDNALWHLPNRVASRSTVQHPGVDAPRASDPTPSATPHILWAARWEYDKNPELFFKSLSIARRAGLEFQLSVIGEVFDEQPIAFDRARREFEDSIVRWGYQSTRAAYEQALDEADIFVSSADHEFFGISVVEAMSHGCIPLLPQRLSYPELLAEVDGTLANELLYDGSPEDCARRLLRIASVFREFTTIAAWRTAITAAAARFSWASRVTEMDDALEEVVKFRSERRAVPESK